MGGAHSSTAKEQAETMFDTLELTPLLKEIQRPEAVKEICPLFRRMTINEDHSIYGPKSM